MRVLHVIHTPRFSGAEMLVCSLTIAHNKQSIDSRVVAIAPPDKNFLSTIALQEKLGINWIFPSEKTRKLSRLIFLYNVIKEYQPSVIVAHSLIPALYARLLFIRTPKVFVLHDANQNDHKSSLYYFLELGLQFLCRAVVGVSSKAISNYTKRFGFPIAKIIPNGVDLELFSKRPTLNQDFRKRHGLKKDARLMVQIGRFTKIKRQDLSLRASIDILRKNPDLMLVFVGELEDIEIYDRLNKMIVENNISDQVAILKPLPRDEIADLLGIASLYLMPSAMEAHSVAMIEALASGIGIVCSDIDSLQFSAAYAGVILVDPCKTDEYTKSIETLLDITHRYERDLSRFDIEKTAEHYLELFGTLNLQ
ncbi:glycosyltransferase family 4 protein [Curvibacter lanceolatus]|uniref:glycosyltransferase family 4 protein n=1 Tax=Curvibacter lanceolatus TaxID=86182 RepID=UPI0009FEDBDC|nr:glycosyltransferase family 4 protein [Curvibacter lanceolatus]